MSDLIARLRVCEKYDPDQKEAADALEAQARRIAELEAALKPFKKYADLCDEASMTGLWSVPGEDLRAARAAYLGEKK